MKIQIKIQDEDDCDQLESVIAMLQLLVEKFKAKQAERDALKQVQRAVVKRRVKRKPTVEPPVDEPLTPRVSSQPALVV